MSSRSWGKTLRFHVAKSCNCELLSLRAFSGPKFFERTWKEENIVKKTKNKHSGSYLLLRNDSVCRSETPWKRNAPFASLNSRYSATRCNKQEKRRNEQTKNPNSLRGPGREEIKQEPKTLSCPFSRFCIEKFGIISFQDEKFVVIKNNFLLLKIISNFYIYFYFII